MLRLRTLGTLDLRDGSGRELRAVLQQPKRLALLAYLAIAGGDRFVRRDTLLGLFWPELDQEHARAALRRALYFLRRVVGDNVIEGRGDDEVGLGAEALWCDAVAFAEALARGQAKEALELYQGPLLEGLYIAGASEAERWLDNTRANLQARAARAAWVLAEAVDAPALDTVPAVPRSGPKWYSPLRRRGRWASSTSRRATRRRLAGSGSGLCSSGRSVMWN